jgi:hypothetical protein
MNKLGMLVAVIQLGACVEAIASKDWQRAIIFAGFAIGSSGVAMT